MMHTVWTSDEKGYRYFHLHNFSYIFEAFTATKFNNILLGRQLQKVLLINFSFTGGWVCVEVKNLSDFLIGKWI
jgi:hypothetical protein